MSNQNRQTLKQYFQTGSTPTQAQFADLIDSGLNQVDDSITRDAKGQIGIGNSAPTANLNVRGKLFTPLTGTVSVSANATAIIGIGTSFQTELAVGNAIRIGAQLFRIADITDATHAELGAAPTAAITGATAFRDTNLLLIENGKGDPQFIIDKSGNVGIGVAQPTAKLQVAGKLVATELAGDGKGLTNLQAANLTGQLQPDQIPAMPPSPLLEWVGELQQAVSVDTAGNVGIGVAQPAAKLQVAGKLLATELAGDGARITQLSASNITGQLNLKQIPAIQASSLSGQLTDDQIVSLSASKLTDVLGVDQLPATIPAAKISGLDQLPLLIDLLRRVSVLEGKLSQPLSPPTTPPSTQPTTRPPSPSFKALRFDGLATAIMLSKRGPVDIESSPKPDPRQRAGVTWQALVNPSTSSGELPLLTYNYMSLVAPNSPEAEFLPGEVRPFALPGTTAAFKVSLRDGTLYFCLMTQHPHPGGPLATADELTTNLPIPPNQWSLVTFVWNYQTGAHLFLEGQEVGQMPCTNTFLPDRMRWGFGNCGSAYFQGQMANISLWDFARSGDAILATRERLSDPQIARLEREGPSGYWPLDEAAGNIARDHTTAANHGDITAPNW